MCSGVIGLRRFLLRALALLLLLHSGAAAAACLSLAGGRHLAVEICAADGGLRTAYLPAPESDEAPPAASFCPACHALPAAPAPPAPLAAPAAPPLPGLVHAPAPGSRWHPEAPAPYPATGPPAA
jgi:hypothetical protein